VCLNALAITLAAIGGVSELFGLAMVVREISSDRDRARTLLDKKRNFRPAHRGSPRRVHASSLESRSPLTQMQRGGAERQVLGQIASLATGMNRLTHETGEALDKRTGELLTEIDKGDAALNAVLRQLLGANLRERVIGVIAIGVGIALSTIASILSSLS
jgi:hypothetical protein